MTPQKPGRVPRERDPRAIAKWLDTRGPRLKKRVTPGGHPRPERPERPGEGPAGPPPLGSEGGDPGTGPEEGNPPEGLGRVGSGDLAPAGPPGAVLPDAGSRLLRPRAFGPVPGGAAPGADRAGRRRVGRQEQAQGGPDPHAGGRLGGATRPGEAAPYAPRLHPVEFVWSWRKDSRWNNFAPRDAAQLEERGVAELTAVQNDQAMLRSFVQAWDLPLRLTLLS